MSFSMSSTVSAGRDATAASNCNKSGYIFRYRHASVRVWLRQDATTLESELSCQSGFRLNHGQDRGQGQGVKYST